MASKNQELPDEPSSFASNLAGIPSFLIDPEGAAKRVRSKWFWVTPLLLWCIIAVVVSIYLAPIAIHAAAVSAPPDGITSEQYAKNMAIGMKVGSFISPITVAVISALAALLLFGMATVMGISAKFGQLFNLVTGCGIITMLGQIATTLVLHFKGEVSSMAELKPPMGPDIFLPEGSNKYLVAAGSAFSLFQIWWVVMMVLIFAAAFRVTKMKSFIAVFPLWLIGLLLSLVGAAFQK
jgi:hypothetical protein